MSYDYQRNKYLVPNKFLIFDHWQTPKSAFLHLGLRADQVIVRCNGFGVVPHSFFNERIDLL